VIDRVKALLPNRRQGEIPIPRAAIVELTRRCNLACRHCYATPERGRRELSREEIVGLLDQLRDIGTLFLTFVGGDPTVNRDFVSIVRHASRARFAVQFFSNGLLIDDATAEALAAENLLHVGISIYGATPEIHDDLTRRRGSFEKTLRAVRRLKERGVHVVFKFIATNRNAHEAWAAVEMARRLEIPIRVDPTITARDDLNSDTIALRPSRDMHKRLLRDFQGPEWTPQEVDRAGNRDLSCGMAKTLVSVNAYGDVFPCVTLPIPAGNIRYAPFRTIWEESTLLRELRGFHRSSRLQGCPSCGLRAYCSRCPGNTYTETRNLYGPSPSACGEAVLWKELENESKGIVEEVPLPPGLADGHLPGWTPAELAHEAGCSVGLRWAADGA